MWRPQLFAKYINVYVNFKTRSHLSTLPADGDRTPSSLCCLFLRFLLLFFLALLLSCGILFCLQCWLKQRSCLPHWRTLAVFALSSSDAFCGYEAPQCPFSGSPSSCVNAEVSSSPAPCFSLGEAELPPSYEDIMKGNKL
uniref:Transmembrane protein 207 n=1 Tax=Apteryx owenii TaxID=8824 RepID=A0A8B9S2U0_APTOW